MRWTKTLRKYEEIIIIFQLSYKINQRYRDERDGDERYILDDGVETLTLGYYKTIEFVYIYITALYCRIHMRTKNK